MYIVFDEAYSEGEGGGVVVVLNGLDINIWLEFGVGVLVKDYRGP